MWPFDLLWGWSAAAGGPAVETPSDVGEPRPDRKPFRPPTKKAITEWIPGWSPPPPETAPEPVVVAVTLSAAVVWVAGDPIVAAAEQSARVSLGAVRAAGSGGGLARVRAVVNPTREEIKRILGLL